LLLPKSYFGILHTFQLTESAGRSTDITRPLSQNCQICHAGD
jgi:hypothetical protein